MSERERYHRVDVDLLLSRRAGDDSTPLVSLVRDDAYSRGVVTSQGRTTSPQYMEFVKRAREQAKRARR